MKIWSNKFFQSIVFVFITISFGIVLTKLELIELVLGQSHTSIDKNMTDSLIKDIKTIRIIFAIIWASAIGLYNNFIYNINRQSSKTNKM